MSTTTKPEKIQLTAEDAENLKFRVTNNLLSEADKKILTGLISFSIWLGDQINLAKLTIFKLRTLFGIKTEKKNSNKNESEKEIDLSQLNQVANDTETTQIPVRKKRKRTGGPLSYEDYSGCAQSTITHDSLTAGGACPECNEHQSLGKLYSIDPGVLVLLKGQPLITTSLPISFK